MGGGGAEQHMALGASFQKPRGTLLLEAGWGLDSQRGRGELISQRGLDSGGLLCFSANMLFL